MTPRDETSRRPAEAEFIRHETVTPSEVRGRVGDLVVALLRTTDRARTLEANDPLPADWSRS